MGLTVAIKVGDMPQEREAARSYVRDLAEQAQHALRTFVGGIPMEGPLAVNLAGPVDDPLQGPIFGLTVAGPFDADRLPADCDAYVAYNGGQGGTIQHDQGVDGVLAPGD